MNIFKKLIFSAPILLAGTAAAQHSLTVNISNLKAGKGKVEIGIYNKAEGFLKPDKVYIGEKVKVGGASTLSYTFRDLPAGDYAVAVYQDENSNGKADTNMIGIPKEGFGFSNNVKPKLSPPTFTQTKFTLIQNKSINITLLNY